MEFTELRDYPVPDGTFEEWFPTTDAQWRVEHRQVSFVQEAHLRRDPAAGTSLSWLGTAFDMSGPLDHDALTSALLAFIDRHEVLRVHTELAPDGRSTMRSSLPTGSVELDRTVYPPARGDGARVNFDRLQRSFDEHASSKQWPSYLFATIASADRFTVFFAGDHSILDGFSIVLVANEITELYDAARTGREPVLPEVGSYVDFGHDERNTGPAPGEARRAVDIWRAALDGSGLPRFPLPTGPHTSAPQGGMSRWLLDGDEARGFGEACRGAGAHFFAGVLTALAIATSRILGPDELNHNVFRAVMPVHTRRAPQWEAALGWFVGLAPVEFTLAGPDADLPALFADSADRARSAIERAVPAGVFSFERVQQILRRRIEPQFVVSYLDVRALPGSDTWPARNARALRSRQYTHDVYVWINRTPEGVNLSMRYPGNQVATESVRRWTDEVAAVMRAVAEPYRVVALGASPR